jgi:hypothetical protein
MSTMGWAAAFTMRVIAAAPPRSALWCRLSASSTMTSCRRSPPRVWFVAARPATRSIASFVRTSEAFSSMAAHPRSAASACAAEVLPTPGEPWITTASPWSAHVSAHSASASRAASLPRTAASVCGR